VKIGIYRIVGAELPPRDIPGTRVRTTEHVLFQDSQLQWPDTVDELRYHWIVNRIPEHDIRRNLQRVFDDYNAHVSVVPLSLAAVAAAKDMAGKIKAAIEINQVRNQAITDGQIRGYDWTIVLDGDCFIPQAAIAELIDCLAHTDKPVVGIPSCRTVAYGMSKLEPVADRGEPMLAFTGNTKERFDESLPFGEGEKLKLLYALGMAPSQANAHELKPDAKLAIAGWCEHICMDTGRTDVEQDGPLRNALRAEGLRRMVRNAVQPRPANAYTAHNKLWESIPGFFDFQGPYSGLAADVPDGEIIVEVGSWLGKSAAYLARELQLRGKTNKLFCVDTWAGDDSLKAQVAEMGGPDEVFATFLRNMRPLVGRVMPIHMSSVEAAAQFDNESIAAVFIDADHTYDAVMEDLQSWFPKVRPGGMIFGHDYVPTHPVSRVNVVAAVDEFFRDKSLELRPMSRVWKHVKPGEGLRIWS